MYQTVLRFNENYRHILIHNIYNTYDMHVQYRVYNRYKTIYVLCPNKTSNRM